MKSTNLKIESHSSMITNKGVMTEKFYIDQLAMNASNNLHFKTITTFFNAVEVWYIGIKDILPYDQLENIKKLHKEYYALLDLIHLQPKIYRNKKVLLTMLKITKQIYSDMITGLQSYDYFFRIGSRDVKGLKTVKFFENSIFATKKQREEYGRKQNEMGEN